MQLGLTGKRALVTGGSRGIGKAVINNFVDEGMSVVTCARGEASLQASVAEWAGRGHQVEGQVVDVTDADAFSTWFDQGSEALGGLDVLVSNVTTRITSGGLARWRETFEVDLLQHIRAAELAIPHMRAAGGGAIVFVASIASVMTTNMPGEMEYGTMKAALISYAAQLANQLGKDNIRVNLVSPGPIHHQQGFWEMVRQKQPDLYKRAEAVSVFNRLGTTEEVANAITFLSSEAASNITAVNLRVDGGAIKTVNF